MIPGCLFVKLELCAPHKETVMIPSCLAALKSRPPFGFYFSSVPILDTRDINWHRIFSWCCKVSWAKITKMPCIKTYGPTQASSRGKETNILSPYNLMCFLTFILLSSQLVIQICCCHELVIHVYFFSDLEKVSTSHDLINFYLYLWAVECNL